MIVLLGQEGERDRCGLPKPPDYLRDAYESCWYVPSHDADNAQVIDELEEDAERGEVFEIVDEGGARTRYVEAEG